MIFRPMVKLLAVDQIADNINRVCVVSDLVNRHDVRVLKPRSEAGLADELFDFQRLQTAVQRDFDGHIAVQLGIAGSPDSAE